MMWTYLHSEWMILSKPIYYPFVWVKDSIVPKHFLCNHDFLKLHSKSILISTTSIPYIFHNWNVIYHTKRGWSGVNYRCTRAFASLWLYRYWWMTLQKQGHVHRSILYRKNYRQLKWQNLYPVFLLFFPSTILKLSGVIVRIWYNSICGGIIKWILDINIEGVSKIKTNEI